MNLNPHETSGGEVACATRTLPASRPPAQHAAPVEGSFPHDPAM